MRVLVTGAGGQVGTEVVDELDRRAKARLRSPVEVIAATHGTLDVRSRDAVLGVVGELTPDLIIHPAAYTDVDGCETNPDRAFAVNTLGTRNLAEAADRVGAHLCYVSTDYVFDGNSPEPYREWDTPNPLSVYGRSKLAGEWAVSPSHTVVRTSWVCGRVGKNMAKTVLRLLSQSDGVLRFVDDQKGCPTVASDLAPVLVDLGMSRRRGVFHVTNQGPTTWYGFARAVATFAGHDPERVEPISTAELSPPRPAVRPANSVLENAALRLSGMEPLPPWQGSLERLVASLLR